MYKCTLTYWTLLATCVHRNCILGYKHTVSDASMLYNQTQSKWRRTEWWAERGLSKRYPRSERTSGRCTEKRWVNKMLLWTLKGRLASNVFRPHHAGGISPVILDHNIQVSDKKRNTFINYFDLCLKTTQSGKSRDYRDVIVLKNTLCSEMVFSVHTKTLSQCFQIPLVWRAFLRTSVFVTD